MRVTVQGVIEVRYGPVAKLKVLRGFLNRFHAHFYRWQTPFKLQKVVLIFVRCAHVNCFLCLLVQRAEHQFKVAADADQDLKRNVVYHERLLLIFLIAEEGFCKTHGIAGHVKAEIRQFHEKRIRQFDSVLLILLP